MMSELDRKMLAGLASAATVIIASVVVANLLGALVGLSVIGLCTAYVAYKLGWEKKDGDM